jgi:formylglycine-generating enzyme required for sulfatase activity
LNPRVIVWRVSVLAVLIIGAFLAARTIYTQVCRSGGALSGGGELVAEVERLRELAAADDLEPLAEALDRSVVVSPAGEFLMGDDAGPANERPQRLVYLDAFEIDRYEVTNVQYQRFVQATGLEPPPYWSGDEYPSGMADFPVVGVTWKGAEAYCGWMGRRLPTEAEWERACRSTDGRVYPWGDAWDPNRANVGGAEASRSRPISYTEPGAPGWGDGWALAQAIPAGAGAVGLRPIGSYPDGASPDGVMDLVGNASEWMADWFNWDGYWDVPDRNPVVLGPEWNRSLRGSSWVPYGVAHWAQERSRCSARDSTHRGTPDARFGFRCVRSVHE